jgi:hypothetical protein
VTAVGLAGSRPHEAETHTASARPRAGHPSGDVGGRATEAASAAGARTAVASRATEAAAGAARAAAAAGATEAASGAGAARANAAARATEAGAARTAAAEPPADPAAEAQAIARRVLDELAARKGPAMADASARGRLLSEFGPELAAAFEEFRKQSGGTGNPAPFREALRERWGIDLTPPARG